MSKKIVKTENRERIQAGLLAFVDNNNGTANISDVASNVSVEGTRLDEDLLNGMQEGLIFTVDSAMTAKAGYDSYELGLVGMYGADNLNGFPLFNGFSLRVKIPTSNTQDVVKVKISGTEYDLVKTFGTSTNTISAGELKQGNVYDLLYDGVRFNIYQNNILPYGVDTGTVLEGYWLCRQMGVPQNAYGGPITAAGTKTAGKIYYDALTSAIYYCKNTNTQTIIDDVNFTSISNLSLNDKIEKYIDYNLTFINSDTTGALINIYKVGKIVHINISALKINLTGSVVVCNLPTDLIPPKLVAFLSMENGQINSSFISNTGQLTITTSSVPVTKLYYFSITYPVK